MHPILEGAFWTLVASGGIYVLSLFALTFPTPQRHVLYAHKINPTYFQDINDVEQFGFLKGQVQPFHLKTPDNETLFAWHVLPLQVYNDHRISLDAASPDAPPLRPAEAHSQTQAFKILASDPTARVVVTFHGNAAHLASSHRPTAYANFLSTSTLSHATHVLTFDYRGFGLSTGNPTEAGLITDAVTFLNHIITDISIPPSRIVLVGQSLGTAVATAVAEQFSLEGKGSFAGLILVSGFSSLPRLLESYSIKGVVPPVLTPLRLYPHLQNWFRKRIADRWETASRITRILDRSIKSSRARGANITILHAEDDWEIPWREGHANFDAAVSALERSGVMLMRSADEETVVLEVEGGRERVSWQKVKYGGHNRVVTFQVVAREILRSFERNRELEVD